MSRTCCTANFTTPEMNIGSYTQLLTEMEMDLTFMEVAQIDFFFLQNFMNLSCLQCNNSEIFYSIHRGERSLK